MTKNLTETMIFPLESDNQFHEAVKMAPIQTESPLLTNESTASVQLTSTFLKKRKPAGQTDTNAPTASLMDIISDPKLAHSSTKSRKIRKTDTETEAIVPTTSTGAKKLVMKAGKIEFEETAQASETRIQSETQKRTTSASFRTSKNAEKWTEEETSRFYEGLVIFGSDFSMVGILFPKRTRDQIKKKFNREEKSDGKRVNEALKLNVNRRCIPETLMETLNLAAVTAEKPGKTAVVDEINQLLCNIAKGNAKML
jgi:transcription factor TFIIIB component B''